MMEKVSEAHLKKKCQPGAGEKTCRYLVYGATAWNCAKNDSSLAPVLNARAKSGQLRAHGDNCPGLGDGGVWSEVT